MTTPSSEPTAQLTIPLLTPQDEAGTLSLVQHVARHADRLLVLGTTSEAPYLDVQRAIDQVGYVAQAVRTVISEPSERPIIQVGIVSDDHERIRTITLESRLALLQYGFTEREIEFLIAPNYNMQEFDADEADARVSVVQEETQAPILLYEAPGHPISARMTPEYIRRHTTDTVGLKDSARSAEELLKLRAFLDNRFSIHVGNEASFLQMTPQERRLFAGLVSGNANTLPRLFAEHVKDPSAGPTVDQEIRALHARRSSGHPHEGHPIRQGIKGMKVDLGGIPGMGHMHWGVEQNFPLSHKSDA